MEFNSNGNNELGENKGPAGQGTVPVQGGQIQESKTGSATNQSHGQVNPEAVSFQGQQVQMSPAFQWQQAQGNRSFQGQVNQGSIPPFQGQMPQGGMPYQSQNGSAFGQFKAGKRPGTSKLFFIISMIAGGLSIAGAVALIFHLHFIWTIVVGTVAFSLGAGAVFLSAFFIRKQRPGKVFLTSLIVGGTGVIASIVLTTIFAVKWYPYYKLGNTMEEYVALAEESDAYHHLGAVLDKEDVKEHLENLYDIDAGDVKDIQTITDYEIMVLEKHTEEDDEDEASFEDSEDRTGESEDSGDDFWGSSDDAEDSSNPDDNNDDSEDTDHWFDSNSDDNNDDSEDTDHWFDSNSDF